jgi:hypothetical protein
VLANGYYGLGSGQYDATQSDVSNFRLYDVTPVPEPAAMTLLALAWRRRRA